MTTKRLFGTDGVRGTAGQYPLDHTTVRRLGGALVRALPQAASPRLLIGRDTRESGEWIEAELARGAAGEGAEVTSVGIVPTPAVAFLTPRYGFDAGIVISASHNPFQDNGIKVFSGRGEKFTESVERNVEMIVADPSWRSAEGPPVEYERHDLANEYLDHLRGILEGVALPSGMKVAIDCANGATTTVAPPLFQSLGLDTLVTGDRPDGRNINLNSGSTHPEQLAALVVKNGCRLGVAFDGDGDRAIFVDESGRILNGDAILLVCASQLQREGRLKGNAVVATVMSNVGLELALAKLGITLVRCNVGDKYVMEEMIARGLSLGGEQSGHVIFSDYLFTGDGLCTALNVIRTMALTGRSLGDLASGLVTYPQVLLNVNVRDRVDIKSVPAVAAAVERVESLVGKGGRLLIRYSGTEPLLRIMIEGRHEGEIHAWAQEIADAVKAHMG